MNNFWNYFRNLKFLEMFNVAQDLANYLQIWLYFCIFREVSRNSDNISSKLNWKIAKNAVKKCYEKILWKSCTLSTQKLEKWIPVLFSIQIEKFQTNVLLKFWGRSCTKICKSCRSRQELSHEYVVLFSIYYFTFKNWLRHSRALQALPKPSKNLEKKLEQT